MPFNCDNCLAKCRADCCHEPVPMDPAFVASHTPIRPIEYVLETGMAGTVAPIAIDERNGMGVCPFLGMDDKCSVYNDRPEVCRKFGTEIDLFMVCSFQSKDGRIRGRSERRWIEKVMFQQRDKALERLKRGEGRSEQVQQEMDSLMNQLKAYER